VARDGTNKSIKPGQFKDLSKWSRCRICLFRLQEDLTVAKQAGMTVICSLEKFRCNHYLPDMGLDPIIHACPVRPTVGRAMGRVGQNSTFTRFDRVMCARAARAFADLTKAAVMEIPWRATS
jgi:hypothetical protein